MSRPKPSAKPKSVAVKAESASVPAKTRAAAKTARAQQPKSKHAPAPQLQPSKRGSTKLAAMTSLMRSSKGATIPELTKATGWQAHSVRGAISGTLKKQLGLDVSSQRIDGVRRYRIAG